MNSRDAPPVVRDLGVDRLDAVMAIEASAYAFPWSRGNFIDSMAAGYFARGLEAVGGELLGYFVAMPGYEELHLLNLTVAPGHQGRGLGRALLAHLYMLGRSGGATSIWLEVRISNERARALYLAEGFVEAGRRRAYYPCAEGRREDAALMSKLLVEEPGA